MLTKCLFLVSEAEKLRESLLHKAPTTDLPVAAVKVILPVSSIYSNCA